jgi:acyl transferase domain-containing protein
MTNLSERIAIVGMAARLPGAGPDLKRFWTAARTAADCSSEVPAGRWPRSAAEYLDPRVANPDTVYSTRGYFLDPFEPDLAGLTIDPGFVRELDVLFHLVLDVGNRAWRGARTEPVNPAKVGVVLGNICLPTIRANALCREYLGERLGISRTGRTNPLNRYVAGLPAGMLAKALGLGGSSFTLDAACASSLYAIKLAADELLAGRADAMLAGGVNGSDSHYTQMGFAQLRALSVSGRCSPFDAKADGLMVGEGAAIFVLKRLSDAIAHGDTILATIAGIGLSNDMHGNLLAPAKEGQLRAMRRAYRNAGWSPSDVDLIECHATGTPVGDAVEFDSLRELWGDGGWRPGQCVIGSVKSTVGHLLTGAGAAATAKATCALQAGILPPQANFREPNPALRYESGPFRVLDEADTWERDRPRRAAVSGFGFGGVNAHLLLEEWTGEAKAKVTVQRPAHVPIAVVGLAAHFGPWGDVQAFQERVFGSDARLPQPKENGWGLASESCPVGFFIDELHFPIDRFRIPPKELEETLPQQLLMLQTAAAALDDSNAQLDSDDPNTGVFIGLGLDPNTTNYHLRWAAKTLSRDADRASPALNANRVEPNRAGLPLRRPQPYRLQRRGLGGPRDRTGRAGTRRRRDRPGPSRRRRPCRRPANCLVRASRTSGRRCGGVRSQTAGRRRARRRPRLRCHCGPRHGRRRRPDWKHSFGKRHRRGRFPRLCRCRHRLQFHRLHRWHRVELHRCGHWLLRGRILGGGGS